MKYKNSQALKERIISDETRNKISKSKKGQPGSHTKKHSEESKIKMSISQKRIHPVGKENPSYGKNVQKKL